jgi:hypothetical protein
VTGTSNLFKSPWPYTCRTGSMLAGEGVLVVLWEIRLLGSAELLLPPRVGLCGGRVPGGSVQVSPKRLEA